ncbi:hypothetical protein GCM10020220_036720 [Nonomuraea rubra]
MASQSPLTLAVAAAPHPGDLRTQQRLGKKTTITVGALPIPDPVSLYIANAKGFFKKRA